MNFTEEGGARESGSPTGSASSEASGEVGRRRGRARRRAVSPPAGLSMNTVAPPSGAATPALALAMATEAPCSDKQSAIAGKRRSLRRALRPGSTADAVADVPSGAAEQGSDPMSGPGSPRTFVAPRKSKPAAATAVNNFANMSEIKRVRQRILSDAMTVAASTSAAAASAHDGGGGGGYEMRPSQSSSGSGAGGHNSRASEPVSWRYPTLRA
ncbi:unnamed protein product, partial [Phaeothamnion confervicola]